MEEGISRIRLRYSSIVNYTSMIYRLVVAIGFIVIVARKLSLEEFALWGIILSVSNMIAVLTLFWRYWSQRFFARGKYEAAGTGFLLTLIYWIPAVFLYLIIALVEKHVLGWGFYYMIFGIPFMLLKILNSYLNDLANVSKPELRGYGGFIYETLRVLLAFLFVASFKMGLIGALLSVEIAMGVWVLFVGITLFKNNVLNLMFSTELAVEWLRNFYVPLITMVNGFLRNGVRAIVSWITASEAVIAYLNIGLSSEGPLLQSSQAATPALYARLLRKESEVDIVVSLRIFFLFSGFMLTTFIALSKTIASMFNPVYVNGHLIIPAISIYAFLLGLAVLYETVLRGIEKIDVDRIPSRKELLHSDLFRVPLARFLSTMFSYMMIFFFLLLFDSEPIKQAYGVSIALILGTIPLTTYFIIRAKRKIPHPFPSTEALAVVIGGIISVLYYIITGTSYVIINRFWEQAPMIGLHIIVAGIIYGATVYTLSTWTRNLVKDGIHTFFKK